MYSRSSGVLNTSKIQFKSNSQQPRCKAGEPGRCAQYFKDTIQKQFTTWFEVFTIRFQVCSILQRYNSKAIHNPSLPKYLPCSGVLNTSKIQFKSNSQRSYTACPILLRCAQYFKDTIQKQFTTACLLRLFRCAVCSILQRYNSKAIHNSYWLVSAKRSGVLNTSKIQFKSNSQRAG